MHIPNLIDENHIEAILEFFPKGLIGVDIESTGLSPLTDKIVELALVKITPDKKVFVFETLINPEIKIPEYVIGIHHITDDMVKEAPIFQQIALDLKLFIQNIPLVAHNAPFDGGFLIKEFDRCKIEQPINNLYDSRPWVKNIALYLKKQGLSAPENYKLQSLASFWGLSMQNHHRAQSDAITCLQVMAKSLQTAKLTKLPVDELKKIKHKSLSYSLNHLNNATNLELPTRFQDMQKYIHAGKVIHIKYQKGRFRDQMRPVIPQGFMPTPQGILLLGQCQIDKVQKKFLLDFIEEIDFT